MPYYVKKSGSTLVRQNRMIKKLSPTQAFEIVKDYRKIQTKSHSTFDTVKDLLIARNISRNVPSKLLQRYKTLWSEIYPWVDIDYTKNIFLERSKLRKHRKIPQDKEYEEYVSKYPRGWYQTYVSHCRSEEKEIVLKDGMFYYYKEAMKQKTWSDETRTLIKKSKQSSSKIVAKEWYKKLYEKYDLVIHVDGKSMEDQLMVWSNTKIQQEAKWLTLAVEAKSWIIVWIRVEKSHNKTNTGKIFRQIISHIEKIRWEDLGICFVTDAWSEYVNNKDLRWIDITDKETGKIAKYLRVRWHWRRITRRPEDNSFVENKNDYIERACLDNPDIRKTDMYGFMCHLELFLQRQNRYLPWSKKSFRGEDITPQENIAIRLWKKEAQQRIDGLHVQQIEKLHRLPYEYKNENITSICDQLVNHVKPMVRRSKNTISYDIWAMHPKSLDSSSYKITFIITLISLIIWCSNNQQYWAWEDNNNNSQKEIYTVEWETDDIKMWAGEWLDGELIISEDQFGLIEFSYNNAMLTIGDSIYTCDESNLRFDEYIICKDVKTFKHTFSYPELWIDVVPYYKNYNPQDLFDDPLLLQEKWDSPFLLSDTVLYEKENFERNNREISFRKKNWYDTDDIIFDSFQYKEFLDNQTQKDVLSWALKDQEWWNYERKLELGAIDLAHWNTSIETIGLMYKKENNGKIIAYVFHKDKDYYYQIELPSSPCAPWPCTMFEEHTFTLFQK